MLQRRITASPQRAFELALQHTAHLVVFDLLQVDDQDVRGRPLHERRTLLEQLLIDLPAQLTLCPQTTSPEQALVRLESWPTIGIEASCSQGSALTVDRAAVLIAGPCSRVGEVVCHEDRVVAEVGDVTGDDEAVAFVELNCGRARRRKSTHLDEVVLRHSRHG